MPILGSTPNHTPLKYRCAIKITKLNTFVYHLYRTERINVQKRTATFELIVRKGNKNLQFSLHADQLV